MVVVDDVYDAAAVGPSVGQASVGQGDGQGSAEHALQAVVVDADP